LYEFTNNWFQDEAQYSWSEILNKYKPGRALEVGSYEGASACFLIDTCSKHKPFELHCIDNWKGGVEHTKWALDMEPVFERFKRNVSLARSNASHHAKVMTYVGNSDLALAGLLYQGNAQSFDFIYVDGSHIARDVLADAVVSFKLLKIGGIMILDDYLWHQKPPFEKNILQIPKLAIDSFVNLHLDVVEIIRAPIYQTVIRRVK